MATKRKGDGLLLVYSDVAPEQDIIDHKGYRRGVGIVVWDGRDRVLLARRSDRRGWPFPQGGVRQGEPPRDAMYRELKEELGLDEKQFSEVHSVLDECIMQEADMFSRIESLRSDGRARIEMILNDQQRETFRNILLKASDRQ